MDLFATNSDDMMMAKDQEKILINFGKRVREVRKHKGLSQEYLADLCGIDRSYIGSVERGERNVSLVNIGKIASALEIDLSDFFKGLDK